MGWNDARVTLVPPGRRVVLDSAGSARTASGEKLRILRTLPDGSAPTERVSAMAFRKWLEDAGFVASEEGGSYFCMLNQEVEMLVSIAESDVTEISLTFRLDSNSFTRQSAWQNLVTGICQTWQMQLVDPQTADLVGCAEFSRLLTSRRSWKEFADAFNWPVGSESSLAELGPTGS